MRERRYGPRVSLDTVATARTGSQEVRCRVVNLAAGGMAIETEPTRELGRFVRIGMVLGPGLRIDLDAIVLRRERRGDRLLWGVEFHQAPPHVLSQIGAFVRERQEQVPAHAAQELTAKVELAGDREYRELIGEAVRSVDE